MRLFRLLPAAFLFLLASPALAAGSECDQPRTIGFADIPALVDGVERRAAQPDSGSICPDYVLRIPIAWTAEGETLVLSTVETAYRAVDLPQLALQDTTGRIVGQGRRGYSVMPAGLAPRPIKRTRAEIKACRKALVPTQMDRCDLPLVQFAIDVDNPDDIALMRRQPVGSTRLATARASGLVLLVAFRLKADFSGDAFDDRDDIRAVLTGLTVVDADGVQIAVGRSSDSIVPPDPAPAPRWVSRPSGDQVNRAYPDRALRNNIAGRAAVSCKVGHFGWLRACEVVSETPGGYGFGDAGRRIAERTRAAAAEPGGDLTGVKVRVPLSFTPADWDEEAEAPSGTPPVLPVHPTPPGQ